MRRLTLILGGLALAAVLAACNSASGTVPTPGASIDPSSPKVLAKDFAFDKAQIDVPAGSPFSLAFDNQDAVPHNVAIYTDATRGTKVFVGEIFGGPATKVYSVPAMAAGSYFFVCDLHTDMNGTVRAE